MFPFEREQPLGTQKSVLLNVMNNRLVRAVRKTSKFQNWSHLTNSHRRYIAEIMPIRRKTPWNQSIIQCIWRDRSKHQQGPGIWTWKQQKSRLGSYVKGKVNAIWRLLIHTLAAIYVKEHIDTKSSAIDVLNSFSPHRLFFSLGRSWLGYCFCKTFIIPSSPSNEVWG